MWHIEKNVFVKWSENQWENIYQKIAEKYADKTKTWKNGLHWANTNGYSPKSMKKLLGCYAVDYSTWFHFLPQIIKEENKMVYTLKTGKPLSIDVDLGSGSAAATKIVSVRWKDTDDELLGTEVKRMLSGIRRVNSY